MLDAEHQLPLPGPPTMRSPSAPSGPQSATYRHQGAPDGYDTSAGRDPSGGSAAYDQSTPARQSDRDAATGAYQGGYPRPGDVPAAPTGGYAAPTGGYAAPTGGYAAPTGGYAAPTGGYAAPTGGYAAPT
ncbi:MAG: hypothetical protein ACQSGP_11885, partial [Frankia sp.]